MSEPSRRKPADKPAAEPKTRTRTKEQPKTKQLPPYKVILHNDDVNDTSYVVRTIIELLHFSRPEATKRMLEAHHRGQSLLTVTHKERAELYAEQFASKGLTVSIEPA